MLNVIVNRNQTCQTKLQCCASHFTIITRPRCDWYLSICEQWVYFRSQAL